jgi:hypothetical protein
MKLARMVSVIDIRRAMRPVSHRAGRPSAVVRFETRPSTMSATIR